MGMGMDMAVDTDMEVDMDMDKDIDTVCACASMFMCTGTYGTRAVVAVPSTRAAALAAGAVHSLC